MPYIVVKQKPHTQQISLEEILSGQVNIAENIQNPFISGTRTYFSENRNNPVFSSISVPGLLVKLKDFNRKYNELHKAERSSLYHTFYIPKRSGGLRRIDEPNYELMTALRELKQIFECDFCALYHTSSFAYIRGRSTISAIQNHQRNDSHWFCKLDFSNFFGSTTLDFLFNMVSQIFPFSEVVNVADGRSELYHALSLCFLNGGLPQGTPISPTLTNLMMIPIDYKLFNSFRRERKVYTRYADDLLISSKETFSVAETESFICGVLKEFNAPFALNHNKTRYGSRAGSNWNLGVMLNKDNQITIGHAKKKQFHAMINNYAQDKLRKINWDKNDVLVLAGTISYYKMIEEDAINRIIDHYCQKYHLDIRKLINNDCKSKM